MFSCSLQTKRGLVKIQCLTYTEKKLPSLRNERCRVGGRQPSEIYKLQQENQSNSQSKTGGGIQLTPAKGVITARQPIQPGLAGMTTMPELTLSSQSATKNLATYVRCSATNAYCILNPDRILCCSLSEFKLFQDSRPQATDYDQFPNLAVASQSGHRYCHKFCRLSLRKIAINYHGETKQPVKYNLHTLVQDWLASQENWLYTHLFKIRL